MSNLSHTYHITVETCILHFPKWSSYTWLISLLVRHYFPTNHISNHKDGELRETPRSEYYRIIQFSSHSQCMLTTFLLWNLNSFNATSQLTICLIRKVVNMVRVDPLCNMKCSIIHKTRCFVHFFHEAYFGHPPCDFLWLLLLNAQNHIWTLFKTKQWSALTILYSMPSSSHTQNVYCIIIFCK